MLAPAAAWRTREMEQAGVRCRSEANGSLVASLHVQSIVRKDVRDRRQAVVSLCRRDMVDMACLAECTRAMLRVAGVCLIAGS